MNAKRDEYKLTTHSMLNELNVKEKTCPLPNCIQRNELNVKGGEYVHVQYAKS